MQISEVKYPHQDEANLIQEVAQKNANHYRSLLRRILFQDEPLTSADYDFWQREFDDGRLPADNKISA